MAQPAAAAAGAARPAGTMVLPTTFSGEATEDVATWLAHFGHCAAANAWPAPQQRAMLLVRIQGAALQFVLGLANLANLTFAQLSAQLTGRFAPAGNIALHRADFRCRRRRAGETLASFGADISKLGRAAYPALPHAVQTELARDQFIDGLDTRDLRLRVRESDPATLDDAITRALHLEAIYAADRLQLEPTPAVATIGVDPEVAAIRAPSQGATETLLAGLIEQVAALTTAVVAASTTSTPRPASATPVPAPRRQSISRPSSSSFPSSLQCYRCGDFCPLHISRSDAPIGLRCSRRQFGTKPPDVASAHHSHWPNGAQCVHLRRLVRESRTILYDSLVGTVKESYLLQLSVALYTFGSRSAGGVGQY